MAIKKEASIDADEAVSYRLPQRVTETLVLPSGNAYPICPRCHTSIEREYMNYCDRCGQAFEWKYYLKSTVVWFSNSS